MEQTTMKALVYHGPGKISLDDVPVPVIQDPHDVIGRVTANTICTSDLHIRDGHIPQVKTEKILGHEFCVEVIEKGEAVQGIEIGKHYVVIPASFCGECPACKADNIAFCEKAGGFGMKIDGCQAEYIRIPFAEHCMIPVPDGKTDEDILLLPDMMATAWFGITNASPQPGQTVAVIGCGPVGLCGCALLTNHFGCKVVAIDAIAERTQKAVDHGCAIAAINPLTDDVKARVGELTGGAGFPVVLETGGSNDSFNLAIQIAGRHGIVSTIAMFAGPVTIPMHELIYKNLRFATGIQNAGGMKEMMADIVSGKVDVTWILSHHAPLNDILKGYEVFGKKEDGCTKWVVTPYER